MLSDVLGNLSSSFNEAISQIIYYLPKIIGAIIIVLIGYIVGVLVKDATSIIINKLFEKPLEKTKFGKSIKEAGVDLGNLIGILVMALVIIISIVAAIDILSLTGYTGELVRAIAIAILNITAGITILAIGIPVSIIFAEYIANFFGGSFKDKHELAVSLIYDITALVLSVFVIALAVKVMFQYNLLLDYIVSAAPGFITASIILFIGYVLGDAIGKIVDKIIDAIVEKPLEATDIGQSIKSMNIDLSGLIGGLTKAFVIVVSIVAAVEIINLGGLTGELVYQIALYLPKLIGGITLLTLGLILSVALARYVGKFLHAMFKEKYSGLASLAENLILLGLITVILTISLNIMLLQGSLIYPLILGIIVIVVGVYVAGTVGSVLAETYPTYKRLAPFIESLIVLIFIVIGASGIFSQFVGATSVINTIAWGLSIAFALVLIPVVFHYTRLAWREASKSTEEAGKS